MALGTAMHERILRNSQPRGYDSLITSILPGLAQINLHIHVLRTHLQVLHLNISGLKVNPNMVDHILKYLLPS